jgi:inhibitor of KinA sporulation pathway (predicted exonuclease)
MAKQLDKILVVDVESTCWEGSPPEGQISEIIEIGIALVDVPTLTRGDKRSLLVKPERSEVSAFCTQLTTLTAEDLKDAGSLAEAAQVLKRELRSGARVWASWGDYDRRQFEKVCQALGVAYPFGTSHLNLKTLFAVASGLHHEVGMAAALERIGLPLEGTHHRGGDDAWNIAGILCWLLGRARGAGDASVENPSPAGS